MGVFDELLDIPKENDRVYSVISGIVKENWDENYPGKVKVEYFLGEDGKNISGWVPVAMPYVSDKSGMYFLPEIGTEVVIAFLLGDRNCPVVMGSLWNQKVKLPEQTAEKDNNVKKIRTKNGQEIIFSGEPDKQKITIQTKGGISVTLDDEQQCASVTDKDGKNRILLNAKEGSLSLEAEKKLELKVGGKALVSLEKDSVSLSAGKIQEKATQSMSLEGQSMNLKGSSMQLKADGSLKAESGGIAEFKGSMVKIN